MKAYVKGKIYRLKHAQFTAAVIKYSLWFPDRFLFGNHHLDEELYHISTINSRKN